MIRIGNREINIGMLALSLYIAMTYIATDIYIPSSLCKVSIAILLFVTVYILFARDKMTLIKIDYKYFFWYFIFSIFCLISIFYSGEISFLGESIYLVYVSLIILFCVSTIVISYEDVINIFKIYSFSSIILFVMLLVSGNLITTDVTGEINRLGSTFTNNSNTFATFQLVSFCVSLWLMLYSNNTKRLKIIFFAAVIVDLIAIALSGARKAIAAAVLYLVISLFFNRDSKGRKRYVRNTIIIILIIIFCRYIFMSNDYLYEIVGARFELLFEQLLGESVAIEGSSSYLRTMYRKLAFEGWLKSPIWGHGFDSFHIFNRSVTGRNVYSHNNFTELLYNGGIISFFLFYGFYIKLLFEAYRTKHIEIKALGLGTLCCLMIFEYGQVDYNSTVILILLCLISKLFAYKEGRDCL